jgi:hypothetical protein
MPSELQNKMRKPGRKQRFWREYGVRSLIAAMATDGNAQDGLNGSVRSSRGRVLYGLLPEDWDDVDTDDLEFFLAAVDAVRSLPEDNPLDKELTNLCKLARFLADGWRVAAVLPYREETRSNIPITRWTWHVRVKRPEREQSHHLIDQDFSIRVVINRIRERLIEAERARIASDTALLTAAGSMPQGRRDGGAAYQSIHRDTVLRYRDQNDRPYYSVMNAQEIGDEDNWADFEPMFYQVGSRDIGKPFIITDALLVTGANAETNEFLFSELARNDPLALVTKYQEVLARYTTVGPPSAWVSAPVVYVEEADVTRSIPE